MNCLAPLLAPFPCPLLAAAPRPLPARRASEAWQRSRLILNHWGKVTPHAMCGRLARARCLEAADPSSCRKLAKSVRQTGEIVFPRWGGVSTCSIAKIVEVAMFLFYFFFVQEQLSHFFR
uniref:Uncharacterized protein n=1 Tax=Ixodes scapularis TaxID=6945 RepID=A0A4D5RZ05_IXOSC